MRTNVVTLTSIETVPQPPCSLCTCSCAASCERCELSTVVVSAHFLAPRVRRVKPGGADSGRRAHASTHDCCGDRAPHPGRARPARRGSTATKRPTRPRVKPELHGWSDQFRRGELLVAGRRVGPDTLVVPLLNVVDPHSTAIPAVR